MILDGFGLGGESTIYTDENKTIINADLFTPPLAKRIRKRNAEIMEKNFAVNSFALKMIYGTIIKNIYFLNVIADCEWRFWNAY